jgi:hypothetical protein
VFVYEVDKELPAKPLDGVSDVAWVPIENASHEAHFRLERALHVTAGILVEPAAKRARMQCDVTIPQQS